MIEKVKTYLKLAKTSIWGLDKGTNNYHPIPLSSEGNEVLVKSSLEDQVKTNCLLKDIINQLKNINTHLALINNEIIDEEDL